MLPRRRRVLVVQHEDDCPAAMVEPWLARAGLACDVLRAHHGRALPVGLGDHAGLIVMGGRMGANDDGEHRHLVPTKALIAATVAAGQPFLGICLGHQLATVALGGQVAPNPHGRTIGLQPWAPTGAGTSDPLTSTLTPGTSVLHWNDDVATRLPSTASRLASAPDGTVQAARFGARAWGVQFHPEVTPEVVNRWREDDDPARERGTMRALSERQSELHRAWERLVRRFARITLG